MSLLRSDLCRSGPSGRLDLWAIGALMQGQRPKEGVLTFILDIHSKAKVRRALEDDLDRSKWLLRMLTLEEILDLLSPNDRAMEILAARLQLHQIITTTYSVYDDSYHHFRDDLVAFFRKVLRNNRDPFATPLVKYVVREGESPVLPIFMRACLKCG